MTAATIDVLALARYSNLGASSRVRLFQYERAFAQTSPRVHLIRQSLLDDAYLRSKYAGAPTSRHILRGYASRLSGFFGSSVAVPVWWLEKELWPWMPAALELLVLRRHRFVLDLDDAVFHNYDLHSNRLIRKLFARKIDRLMRAAALVTAGNDYLAERARRAGAARVEVVPTVVDVERYRPAAERASQAPLKIVWIGSPATEHYLRLVEAPLALLAKQRAVVLRVIGSPIVLQGIATEHVAWSEATEADSIADADIGIMPLADSPWERGKCGYKLVQYMACGLPVVASPVGVNCRIVSPEVNGYLADGADQWLAALLRLCDSRALRSSMGNAGRERAVGEFSVQAMAPRLARWLGDVACARS